MLAEWSVIKVWDNQVNEKRTVLVQEPRTLYDSGWYEMYISYDYISYTQLRL